MTYPQQSYDVSVHVYTYTKLVFPCYPGKLTLVTWPEVMTNYECESKLTQYTKQAIVCNESKRNVDSPSNASVVHSDYLCRHYVYLKVYNLFENVSAESQ